MIAGLVQILLFQGIGEVISEFLLPFIPGPVIGLVLLLGFLVVRKAVPPGMNLVASALVQNLGLLFVPAAVGVVLFLPQLGSHALTVALALLVSVVLTIAVPALLLRAMSKGRG
jgi:holin-like protein